MCLVWPIVFAWNNSVTHSNLSCDQEVEKRPLVESVNETIVIALLVAVQCTLAVVIIAPTLLSVGGRCCI